MQHISPSWHCKRKTHCGPSNRLTTNLLCLAALFLFALMPSVGWAQQQRVSVTTQQELREALENPAVTYIKLTKNIVLDNGHCCSNNANKKFSSVYLVKGNKTLDGVHGTNYKIERGNYKNNSIVLTEGAKLKVKNVHFDGKNIPNYAPLLYVSSYAYYDHTAGSATGTEHTVPVHASLEIDSCTIENCKLIQADTIGHYSTNGGTGTGNSLYVHPVNSHGTNYLGSNWQNDYSFSWSGVWGSMGAAVYFAPTADATANIDNKITIKNSTFRNNEVDKGSIWPAGAKEEAVCGGAVAMASKKSKGGTIENCTFIQNRAGATDNCGYGAGGAIIFYKTLHDNFSEFNFTGTNKIGGPPVNNEAFKNSSGKDGGGIQIEGGNVIIDGKTDISYNTAENMGGGISHRGGNLYFQSSNNGDHVHIHHNVAGFNTNNGCGGGIFVQSFMPTEVMTLSNHENVKLTISNNTCKGNVDNGFGGGIYIGSYKTDQGAYIWDTQKHRIILESASTNPDGPRILISGNEADDVSGIDSRGGGISVQQTVVATFTKCIIQGNKAKGYGGGISLYGSEATFNGCLIEENHAWGEFGNKEALGGGVSVENTGNNKFIGGTIRRNGYDTITKTHDGGGVSITSGGKVEFSGNDNTYGRCHIHQNKAIDDGGGLYMDSDNGILIGNCHVEDNTAINGGGIYYKNGGFENTNYVYSNIADTCGGGVYVDIGNQKELKGLVIGSNVVAANVDRGNRAKFGGGIYAKVGNDKTLTINDCKIVHNKWQSHDTGAHIDIIKGGGLYMSESNNYTVDLQGGTIIEYNEAKDGGGVYVSDDATANRNLILQLSNTSLSYNKATTGHGGGIYNDKKVVQSSNASNVTLNGNKALAGNGGGIYNDGTCTLNNCRIGQSGNSNGNSAKNGGGIYNNTNRTTNLGGTTTFENNEATINGGGLYNYGTTTFIAGGDINFTGNIAMNDGGGLYNKWQVTQEVTERDTCKLAFVNDTASNNGGGVYHTRHTGASGNTELTLYGATFKGNHAVENGGGIYTEHACILNGCHIGQYGNGNSAKNGGGIYKGKKVVDYLGSGMLTISGGKVSNNTASNNGGGIYLENGTDYDGTYVNDSCLIQWNEATNDGGGIYLNGQHGFVSGYYIFYSCAILKHDGTEGPTIDLSKLVVRGGVQDTLFWYGNVCSDFLQIQPSGIISTLSIHYYIEETPEINAWTNNNNNGDYFLLRLRKQDSNNVFAEVKCKVRYYAGYPPHISPNYNYVGNDVQVENSDVVAISTTITLNGCTVGGETNKGNKALAGNGGGIYISPNATAIMTSDTNNVYSSDIRNDVTHNKANRKAGGVYKDGTLKVEGHVVITENTAEHSTGGGGGGGKSADGSGQPEAGAIPAGTAAEKEE